MRTSFFAAIYQDLSLLLASGQLPIQLYVRRAVELVGITLLAWLLL